MIESFVQSLGFTAVVRLNDFQIRQVEGIENADRVIRRTVINDDDIYLTGIILSFYTANGFGDFLSFIVSGDQ
jgi:hypothetical protein